MDDADLCYSSISELSAWFTSREVSPVEATRALLERIEALDSTLHAYAAVRRDGALADAQRAEEEIARGEIRGPLHGAPLAVKDL